MKNSSKFLSNLDSKIPIIKTNLCNHFRSRKIHSRRSIRKIQQCLSKVHVDDRRTGFQHIRPHLRIDTETTS